jgi:hypothetical protein
MCNIQTIVGATESTIDFVKGEGTLMDIGESIIEGELGPLMDMMDMVGGLFEGEAESSAEASTKSGVETTSLNLGEGPITINVTANASASADAEDESSALSVSEDQSTKDVEGTETDYGVGNPDGTNEEEAVGGAGEEAAPINSEIEGMKEGIADGLMALEELEPGFIDDVIGQVEVGASADAESNAGAADRAIGNSSTEDKDTAQQSEEAEAGEAAGGNEELLASLEELAVKLEDLIGQLEGDEADQTAAGEAVSEPEDVAAGMSEELGDGKALKAAQSNPLDTFMEIFDQMSPDAQNEVVEILASGVFGEEGLEAADAVKDDATGEIDVENAVDEAEAA